MDAKKLASLKRRIKKDRTTLSVGGAMTLTYEFDVMAIEDLLTLRESLDFQYRILNEAIERRPNITMTYCLYDWAGNMLTDRKGHALEFDSFDDGWAYISDNYCEADQEDLYILEKDH